jgi:hypothetical protein
LRLLRDWGVCTGWDFGAEQIVVTRAGRLGEDSGEARFTVFHPRVAKTSSIRIRRISDTARTFGSALHNGERLLGVGRSFSLSMHRMYAAVAGRPDFVVPPEGAFTGPPTVSSDNRLLIVTVPGGVRAFALDGPDGEPLRVVWRIDEPDKSYEAVSCRDGRLVLLGTDAKARILDERTGRTLASVAGVRSDAGRLVDCLSIPGMPADLLVFGGSYLRNEPDRKAVAYEIVALDPAAGAVAWRTSLAAPDAAAVHGGIWLTPAVAGSTVFFGAVTAARADPSKADLNLWAVSAGNVGEPVHRRFPLNPGEGEFRPGRITDNLFGVVGRTLLVADGATLAAYPLNEQP